MQVTYSYFLCNFQCNSFCPFIISDSTDKQESNNSLHENSQFPIFLGQHLTNLNEILVSSFHGNHCLKTKYLVLWKIFNKSD